jgi:allophanate hydrolase subunit 2
VLVQESLRVYILAYGGFDFPSQVLDDRAATCVLSTEGGDKLGQEDPLSLFSLGEAFVRGKISEHRVPHPLSSRVAIKDVSA